MTGHVVGIVQARMGSQRLPGKVLEEVLGAPMLVRQLERVARAKRLDEIVVATGTSAMNDPIEQAAAAARVRVVRGSDHDVLSRYRDAAAATDAGIVARLTGDCPLIDPQLIDEAVAAFRDDPEVDFVSNALSESYPDGMDVEVFSRTLLERAAREARLPSEREHVTFWFWQTNQFRVRSLTSPRPLGHLRLTVDYPEDLELVRLVYDRLYAADPAFGLDAIVELLDGLPKLPNAHHHRNEGWAAAMRRDRAEGRLSGRTAS